MAWLGARLLKHTLLGVILIGGSVLAPLLLLLRNECGDVCVAGGLTFLIAGSAALLGAAIFRGLDLGECTLLQRKLIVAAVWILNPTLLAVLGVVTGAKELAWWCAMPLAAVLCVLTARVSLAQSDPNWVIEGCPLSPYWTFHWTVSRLVFVGLPMLLLSLQVDLFLPSTKLLPQTAVIGLFVCGGCVLISLKFCAMCACLANQKLAQAIVLVMFLAADWVSSLHIMALVSDDFKDRMLLCLLLASGIVQSRGVLTRLSLRSRWQRALAQRNARDLGGELSAAMAENASSDSDNEQGPGSLPEGFHEALVALLGFQVQQNNSRRQFLCGVRLAANTNEAQTAPDGSRAAPAGAAGAGVAVAPADAPAPGATGESPLPLEISSEERICVVCQDDIQPGERVRPLPKCSHVFHAACLEHWARTMREATRCPTCRKPALARKEAKGSTKISDLPEDETQSHTSSTASSRQSRSRPGQPRRSRRARPETRANQMSALRLSLGISERLAQVAVDVSGGGAAMAAHLVLEHRSVIEAAYVPGGQPSTPSGVVAHVIQASPSLAGTEPLVAQQLARLYASGRLRATPWAELPETGKVEVFTALLEDVSRSLESAV